MTGAPPKVPTAARAAVALVAAPMRADSAAAAACAAATARAMEGALPVAALLEGCRTATLLGGGSGGACEGGGADGAKYGSLIRPKYGSPTRPGCCCDGCDGSAGDGRQSGGIRAAWRWEWERDACAAIGGTAALWNGPELRFVNCRTSSWERVSSRREGSMLWWRGGWDDTTSTIPSRGQSRSRSALKALSSRPGPVPGPVTRLVTRLVPGPAPEPLIHGGASPRGSP